MSTGRPGLHSEARETLLKAIAAAADGVTPRVRIAFVRAASSTN